MILVRAIAPRLCGALGVLALAAAAAAAPYRPPEKAQVAPRPPIGEPRTPSTPAIGQPLDLMSLSAPVASAAAGRARSGPGEPAWIFRNGDRSTLTHDPAAIATDFEAPPPEPRAAMPEGLALTATGFTIEQTGR